MTYLNVRAPSGHLRCANLRCKEMFYRSEATAEQMAPIEAAVDDKHVYWCAKTANRYGADNKMCSLEECSPERDCYEG